MKLDVKMVNLLGTLVVVAVLGLGAVGIVMPLYEQVQVANGQIGEAELANEGYRTQLTALADAESRQAEIEENVATLRAELPGGIEADTAIQVIEHAMNSTGARIESDTFSEPVPFSPRVTPGGELASADDAESPKQQVELDLVFNVTDTAMATAVLDELRAGPRSLLVVSAATGEEKLNVKLLLFFYKSGETL